MTGTTLNPVSTNGSLRRRALGVLAAVAGSVATWLVGALVGVNYAVLSPGEPETVVNLIPVIVVSLGAALLGWATLAVLERIAGRRATVIWLSLVVAVTLLSFVPLLQVEATVGAKVALGVMHLVVPAALIALLPRRGD
ncbi:hypothetical protein SAMN05443287_10274 [Micromonospora phaseoli]|uniref:Uncharacterized protein n=1 Tax=Micromonospora phaseoli TaxID=1144548 RepID=A0A1H6UER2_9ACTN|nr:DUF6069 family protein [Micromonospora phaseoli]PZV98839.1 hypothetical protein CLV64_10475 [Micromonospora phaseoli]GIJ76410.1 hypothetical protein Xph01_08420 [Micromonospora phaseoli]SEI86322.1 hypothetical protein SAMN05443287_10274 [Micromonospora phaseoli]